MPNFTHRDVADAPLTLMRNTATHIFYRSDYASTYHALNDLALGNHAAGMASAPADDVDSGGRFIQWVVATTATYTANGEVTHIAIVDGNSQKILRINEVAEPWQAAVGRLISISAPIRAIQGREGD